MRKLLIYVVIFLFAFSLLPFSRIFAESCDDLCQQLKDKEAQIQQLESQLQSARNQEKTLSSQLNLIDGQMQVTNLKIEDTNLKIEKLKREIDNLAKRIDRIGATLDTLSEILLHRIVQTYKFSNSLSTLDLIFSSQNFADLIERLKYIQVAQSYDKKKLYELQATKLAYNDQKQDKQTRQQEAVKLNKDLENYKQQLAQQKKDKDELLRVTQNDESRYQNLIAQLRAELASITQAISNIGPAIGPVTKGQTIAGMGSTGCSTGPHLHFEVYENAKVEGGKIVGIRVNPHNYLDNSKLGSPLQGYPPGDTVITTEYGELYFLGTHTGLDIAPKGGGGLGRPIIAADNGVAYSTSALCTDPYTLNHGGSTVGKGVVVDHQNGIVTLYWHIL